MTSPSKAEADAPPVTRTLAEFVASHSSRGWDDRVEREAQRTFLNWVGCAVGASRHASVEASIAALRELDPAAQATVLGRSERLDMAGAALVNGIASHAFDFDDTHLATIIHPAGPVASAAFALGEHAGASGRQLVDALVLGVDVACRVGNMIYPDHYDRGWHITGSTGMLGAAAACARLLALDADRTTMALGIAASQPTGVREQFGSMTKALHPGAAARAGLVSALLARHGYTASPRAIEAPRGLAQTYSTKCDWSEIGDELGRRFEIAFNSYKPYACGVVIHPSIDGCIQLARQHALRPQDIERIVLKVHPLVLELTGKKSPRTGLEGKFSVYHACAAGIIFGQAAEPEFSDAVVARADVVALRGRVDARVDGAIAEDAADVTIRCRDGRDLNVFVAHAIGSLERPMSDEDLQRKFHGLVDPVLGAARAEALLEGCAGLAGCGDLRALAALARP
ncbi:MAG TPA: MmgE/PrpD family protein [Caldimonas sp.]|nr:MmgE/PrpD family protein [Caldimonas sp.]